MGGLQINLVNLIFALFSERSRCLRFFRICDPKESIFDDFGCRLDLRFSSNFETQWNIVFWNKYQAKALFLQIQAPRFGT